MKVLNQKNEREDIDLKKKLISLFIAGGLLVISLSACSTAGNTDTSDNVGKVNKVVTAGAVSKDSQTGSNAVEDSAEEIVEEAIEESVIEDDIVEGEYASEDIKENEGTGITLYPTILRDNCGIDAFYTLIPEGWTASVNTNYTIHEKYPLQSFVNLKSPDSSVMITMITPMFYYEMNNSSGSRTPDDCSVDMLKYATYLNYRQAAEYGDYVLKNAGMDWIYNEKLPVDQNQVDSIEAVMKRAGESSLQTLQYAYNNTYGNINTKVSLNDYGGFISRRKGLLTDGVNQQVAEMTSRVGEFTTLTESNIPNPLIQLDTYGYNTCWGSFGIEIYAADDDDLFDKYYDMAQFIIENSGTTSMYEACKQSILNYIIPLVVQGNIEAFNQADSVMKDAMQSFSDTNDRVNQMWDDYILDQDRYSMSDGSQITVPTTANYVYSDGENVIWSEYASFEPGAGYQQIN